MSAFFIESVTDLGFVDRFHVGEEVADLTLSQKTSRDEVRLDDADLVEFITFSHVEGHKLLEGIMVKGARHNLN